MGARSGIEWTDASWNPVRARHHDRNGDGPNVVRVGWHCEHVSEGCRNCYAEGINRRLGTKLDFKPGHREKIGIFLDEKLLTDPLRWRKPRAVFLSSMTDVFADFVSDAMLDRMFAAMALCPQHFFRVLTKRPERMRGYVSMARAHPIGLAALELTVEAMERNPKSMVGAGCMLTGDICHLKEWPLPNVGLGVSVEDQATADERIPLLLDTPAAMRFVSAEPLLGAVDLRTIDVSSCEEIAPLGWGWLDRLEEGETDDDPKIDEVIVGGESGAHARPMHPDWARSLRDQCAAAGTAFFFKQWGEWAPQLGALDNVPDDPEQSRYRWAEWSDYASGTFEWEYWDRPQWCDDLDPEQSVIRVGKKLAGAMLDGREHRGVAPQVTAHFERIGRAG